MTPLNIMATMPIIMPQNIIMAICMVFYPPPPMHTMAMGCLHEDLARILDLLPDEKDQANSLGLGKLIFLFNLFFGL